MFPFDLNHFRSLVLSSFDVLSSFISFFLFFASRNHSRQPVDISGEPCYWELAAYKTSNAGKPLRSTAFEAMRFFFAAVDFFRLI